jgi:hypothetical protein
MKSTSWGADSRSAGQEILIHLRNPNVHYRIQKSLSLDLPLAVL